MPFDWMPPSSCQAAFILPLTRKAKRIINGAMAKTNLLPKKNTKQHLTVRLDPALRKEAEKLAKSNNTTMTNVVETGLTLLFEKVKHEQKA